VAVASAGPYASLYLDPDRKPHQHPTTQFSTGQMPFIPLKQQRQSTKGTEKLNEKRKTHIHGEPQKSLFLSVTA